MINRIVVIVIDSLGIGALPDADKYGDAGANTLGHIIDRMGSSYQLPNLKKLGLLNTLSLIPQYSKYKKSALPKSQLEGSFGAMMCKSPAKDSTIGHWELAGLEIKKPLPTYPNGFPKEIIEQFEREIGTKILGNCIASGTEIIKKLGQKHVKTGYPIVYTSADSVFQIAAHEEAFGLDRLYKISQIARKILKGEHAVGRVIARPFTGKRGGYVRTTNRKDFSLVPFGPTILDAIKNKNGEVVAIGKIADLFSHTGLTKEVHTSDNLDGMKATLDEIKSDNISGDKCKLIFTNLVEFDMNWGHRRDVISYANGLKDFDDFIPGILSGITEKDMLIITADHGCDPTYVKHTDHTREYVPVVVYGKSLKKCVNLGIRKSFCDVAATIDEAFSLKKTKNGKSFLDKIV